MWTAKELRFQAGVCLELAKSSKEYFVRLALTELARELYQSARRTERRERDGTAYSHSQAQSQGRLGW
jgi:hypothetical protein